MLIQVGYELVFNCPQRTPMILMVNVHYSRASDIVRPDCLTTDPETPITAYRDGFGNWCSRIVAPIGRIRLTSTGVVRDSATPDVSTIFPQQDAVVPVKVFKELGFASHVRQKSRLTFESISQEEGDVVGHVSEYFLDHVLLVRAAKYHHTVSVELASFGEPFWFFLQNLSQSSVSDAFLRAT